VKTLFALQQFGLFFHALGVGHATVDRAYGCALGFFMKTNTLGTLVGYDVVVIVADGFLTGFCIYLTTVFEEVGALDVGAVVNGPIYAPFIDGVIGALWFASAAVDAFVCNHYGHGTDGLMGQTTSPLFLLAQKYAKVLALEK
jgi:hypothetical protein